MLSPMATSDHQTRDFAASAAPIDAPGAPDLSFVIPKSENRRGDLLSTLTATDATSAS